MCRDKGHTSVPQITITETANPGVENDRIQSLLRTGSAPFHFFTILIDIS